MVSRLAAPCEGLDDDPAAAAAATWTRQHAGFVGGCGRGRLGLFGPGRHGEQFARPRDVGGAIAVGEQSIVADAVQTLGEHVHQKAPNELVGWQRHGLVRKPLAAVNVAPLRARTEFPRVHVFDHAMTQRGDGARAHEKLLSWMRLTTPRSSRQGAPAATDDLYPDYRAPRISLRPRLSGLSRSDLVRCRVARRTFTSGRSQNRT